MYSQLTNNVIECLLQWCDFYETDSCALCYAGSGKQIYWGVYDHRSDKGWYVERTYLTDDLGIGMLSRPKYVYEGCFVSVISLEKLSLSETSILKDFPDIGDLADCNPVVILYKPL